MIYDSLKLFLEQFCKPANCSSVSGMDFQVKSELMESLTNEHSVWIFINPDFETIDIKCIFDEADSLVEANSQIPLIEANFQKIIAEIEKLAYETRQKSIQ